VIASSELSHGGDPSAVTDVTLTETGTHVVWVARSFDGGYSLEISCQGP